jgi:hypothetical protein
MSAITFAIGVTLVINWLVKPFSNCTPGMDLRPARLRTVVAGGAD